MRFFTQVLASAVGALLAIGVVLIGGLLIPMIILSLFSTGKKPPTIREHSVLALKLTGMIPERRVEDPFATLFMPVRPISLAEIRRTLREAARDERIDVLYLEPRFLLTGWATLDEVRNELLAFKRAGKTIVAYAGTDGMGEKEYYLASVADEIYAPPEAFFELNGFYLTVEFYKDLLDKLEVHPQVIRAGAFKSAVEPFVRDTLSRENALQLSELIQTQHTVFRDSVASRRDMEYTRLEALIQEGIFTAREAVEVGLIDSLFYKDQVEERLLALSGQEKKVREVSAGDYYRSLGIGHIAENDVVVIYAEGAIVSGVSRNDPDPIFGGAVMGAETIVRELRRARESERVRAVVLRINSPGGAITAADAIWREARRLADVKPLVVSMGDVAASGGYYIATPADTIVAEPLTITGSIGVFSLFFDISDFFEDKIGIDFDVLKTAPHADMLSGLRPLLPSERAKLHRQTEQYYMDFLQRVSEGRGLSLEEVARIAEGRIWTGVKARELGLVDVLGGLTDAVRIAAEMAGLEEGAYRVREWPRPKTFLERLSAYGQVRARSLYYRYLASDAERRAARWAQYLAGLREWHGRVQMRLPFRLHVY